MSRWFFGTPLAYPPLCVQENRISGRRSPHMKMLMIIARDSMVSELEKLMHDIGIKGYSTINNVGGKGKLGTVYESLLHAGAPGFNVMMLAVVPSDHVDKAVSGIKAFHAALGKEPLPFKLFSFPCEELI